MNEILQYLTVFILSVFVGYRGDLQGPEHPAHPAHERVQRDPRRDHRRRDARPRPGDDQRRGSCSAFSRWSSRTLNVVGGFVVTDRMLEMFKPRQREAGRGPAEPPTTGRRREPRHLPRPLLPGRGDHFIVALKGLSSSRGTRVAGNLVAAGGMALAIAATFAQPAPAPPRPDGRRHGARRGRRGAAVALREDDRDPAARRDLQRRRRRGRGARLDHRVTLSVRSGAQDTRRLRRAPTRSSRSSSAS